MGKWGRYSPVDMPGVLSCLFLFAVLVVTVTGGEVIGPGTLLPAFTLKDQHGKNQEVNEHSHNF